MGQQREYDTRLTAIFQDSPENWYQNVSIRDFTGAKDNGSGGDNWSCKMCKVPVKSSPPTNQHQLFYKPDALPVAQRTALKQQREKVSHPTYLLALDSPGAL